MAAAVPPQLQLATINSFSPEVCSSFETVFCDKSKKKHTFGKLPSSILVVPYSYIHQENFCCLKWYNIMYNVNNINYFQVTEEGKDGVINQAYGH